MCSVVPNLGWPTPPPEGPPSIPRAPVQPGPNQSLQGAAAPAAAGVHRLPMPMLMPMLTNTHTRATTHSLFLFLTPSFLPSLFLDLLCRSTTPSQRRTSPFAPHRRKLARGRLDCLRSFIWHTYRHTQSWFQLSQSLVDPKPRLLVTLFCSQPKSIIIILPPESGLAARHSPVPVHEQRKIISPPIPLRNFHATPQSTNSHYSSRSEAIRLRTSNVPRKTE